MLAVKRETCPSYPVSIFIAGDANRARSLCREMCDRLSYCVTVTPTTYVYKGGEEAGVIIGLINYPRFPLDEDTIRDRAIVFAEFLREGLGQEGYTNQAPDGAVWISHREQDA